MDAKVQIKLKLKFFAVKKIFGTTKQSAVNEAQIRLTSTYKTWKNKSEMRRLSFVCVRCTADFWNEHTCDSFTNPAI